MTTYFYAANDLFLSTHYFLKRLKMYLMNYIMYHHRKMLFGIGLHLGGHLCTTEIEENPMKNLEVLHTERAIFRFYARNFCLLISIR